MSATGYTPIILLNSTTSGNTPTTSNLAVGELAINIADGKLFFNQSGTIKVLANATYATSVSTISFGTTGLTPSTATNGVVTVAGTLVTTNGGTGLSTYTAGDLPYYASGTALSKLGIGSSGQILTSTGSAPQWSTLSGVAVTTFSAGTTGFTPSTATSGAVTLAGTLGTTNGGTGLTSFTANGVVYASSTSALATGSNLVFDGSNLGVGTTSPSSYGKTSIRGYVNVSGQGNVSLNLSDALTSDFSFVHASGVATMMVPGPQALAFATNATERMRIDSSGNLLVGTTTVSNSSIATFYKTATASNQRVATFINNGTSGSTTAAGIIISYPNASSGNGSTFIQCSDSNTDRFYVLGSGNVQNANNSYGAISDVKLKDNITDATPKLADLLKVQVRNYNLKSDPSHKQLGVVAQELEQVFPSMVEESSDKDIEGNDLGTTTKSVKYSVFVPMLIKAIQELNAEIQSLKAEVATLKGA